MRPKIVVILGLSLLQCGTAVAAGDEQKSFAFLQRHLGGLATDSTKWSIQNGIDKAKLDEDQVKTLTARCRRKSVFVFFWQFCGGNAGNGDLLVVDSDWFTVVEGIFIGSGSSSFVPERISFKRLTLYLFGRRYKKGDVHLCPSVKEKYIYNFRTKKSFFVRDISAAPRS